ncbi:MAG: xanthine dehydrogenase family protein subunit M [Gemmatimonadaceae bacterium]
MRTATNALELRRPRTLKEALAMLRDEPTLVPLAGCTDLYVAVNFGTLTDSRFLDLWPLEPLRRISVRDETMVIGALATYTEIIKSRHVRKRLPMLIDSARQIGGPQIQNRGTIGGNIANASPAGDTLPVLSAADAVVVLKNAADERRVAFNDFHTGYRKSVRMPDELIVAVEIPTQHGRQWFRKVGTRAAQAISKVVMAGVRGDQPRIAIGSVAPTIVRARRTEAALAAGASIEDAARILGDEIHPIDDVRSTAEYRRTVTVNLLRRFWTDTASASPSV